MQDIRAFVGHSFRSEDEGVVRLFLDHFDTLAKAQGGFTWDHAKDAESTPLNDKVLRLIRDKNLFVGICTRSELAVNENDLSDLILQREYKKVKRANLKWKASDWIIQEIGLAVGLQMTIIVFLEDGVRTPGGLFGNIEYIDFDRNYPHRSFDKFLQMLSGLQPKEGIVGSTQGTTSEVEKKEEQIEPADDWAPKPEWTIDNYDNAAFWLIYKKRSKEFEIVDQAFRSSIHAQGNALHLWDGQVENLRLQFGENGNFERLQSLSKDHPDIAPLAYFVGRGFETFREFDKAAAAYEQAAGVAKSDDERVRNLGWAVSAYAQSGKLGNSLLLIEKMKDHIGASDEARRQFLSTVEEWGKIAKEEDFRLIAMEMDVEATPGDNRKRFTLAFEHSVQDHSDMALYHYLKIPSAQRDKITWNNLGVCYGEIGVRVRQVGAFRRSETEGETLAMSNLGSKFLNAGFLKEAREECDRALAIKGYHKNVAILLTELQSVSEVEDKKVADALEKVKAKADFYRMAGASVLCKTPDTLPRTWNAADVILEGSFDGMELKLQGVCERPVNALASVTMLGSSAVVKETTEYAMTVRGHLLSGHVSRRRNGVTPSLLETAGGGTKVLMYLSADQSELHVMENFVGPSPIFYTLTAT